MGRTDGLGFGSEGESHGDRLGHQKSNICLRGNVSTTYYSQKQTGGATPFGETDKPVFFTAAAGEIDHRAETAVYTGNARAWQENNFVRGDRLTIIQKKANCTSDGTVQSLLYNAKEKRMARQQYPVFATSKKLVYTRDSRLLRYESDVDIRQGTDRITGGVAKSIYRKQSGRATEMENSVIITQPNRRATGDYANTTLRTKSLSCRESGEGRRCGKRLFAGPQITVYLRDNRVVAEGRSKQNTAGRIRSVYKIKNN